MGRYKIMFLTTWYPSIRHPGAGIFVQEHAKAVQKYDDVLVLHADEDGTLPQRISWSLQEETDPVLHQHIPTYHLSYPRLKWPVWRLVTQVQAHLKAFRRLQQHGFRPDLIHAHIYRAGAMAVIIGRLFDLPVVITEQYSAFPRKQLSRLAVWEAKFAFERANRVMPVSRALQKGIEAYGIQANFQLVPNVANNILFSPSDQPKSSDKSVRIVFVGSLIPVKGIDTLLKSLARLKKQPPAWMLDIVGDGAFREEYQNEARELGVADRINWHGFRPKEYVADIMRQADFFVLPSVWDNFPCVLVEAQATGLPIVASNVGGIPEIVSEATGILAPPQDAEGLAFALEQMLQKVNDFDRQAIHHEAQKYTYEVVGAMLHKIYEDCLV